MKGLVHIYTGNGKGKTTAAVGLGLRAWGRGMKVLMVQFLKGMESGELIAIRKLGDGFHVNPGIYMGKFTWNMNEKELAQAASLQKQQFEYAKNEIMTGKWDLLILDEIMAAITAGMIPLEDVLAFIKGRPDKLEIVMTGRNAPDILIEAADYVSNIQEVKHPLKKGVAARRGIED
ncbi:MAG TPA: cob(I)yrinic acid a,c-diamide adenosyltransferase [Clostridiales bacterium]|nr:cob(I)yrinic acid a,c-diamide adenosyltransferase [Clostridiales bacterium]